MSDRIEALLAMLEKSPDDVLLNYSLGMEYSSAGHYAQAVERFQKCIDLDGDYIAAYVEAGKALRSAGELQEAREMLAAGMELAARGGESHVRDYIQQQLDSLPKDDKT